LLNHIDCVLSRYLKNATNSISDMFYLRTSYLRHKIMPDNFGSESDWESIRFRITAVKNKVVFSLKFYSFYYFFFFASFLLLFEFSFGDLAAIYMYFQELHILMRYFWYSFGTEMVT